MKLLRFLFGFGAPVDRCAYASWGVSLAGIKYSVDAALIGAFAGRAWTPAEFFLPLGILRGETAAALPGWLAAVLVAWALPFVWIGVSLTLRRAVDAGRSPWTALWFFAPFANYLVFAWLSAAPSRSEGAWDASPVTATAVGRMRSALRAVAASIGVGTAAVLLGAVTLQTYGVALFITTPFVLGLVAAFLHNHGHPRSHRETARVVLLSLVIVGGSLILFALEGLICVAMAFPLALIPAMIGATIGRAIAVRRRGGGRASAAYAFLLLPTAALSDGARPAPPLFHATTAVEIDAPPATVWENVIAFREIQGRPELPFRVGIAYPLRARIEGEGVGAVRYCEFSTGPFVEPITAWDAPRRLAFDVASQPAPLREWSPYRTVYAPHVDGFFQSRRGEFRLIELPGGLTRLEGTTWYELDVHPHVYWRPVAEWLLTRIHTRVLDQVRLQSEMDALVAR